MNKSLLSLVLAHREAKPELPLISGLLGNLTPSYPETRVWVLCPFITVRPLLWEALARGGPNLPCPSPEEPLVSSHRFPVYLAYQIFVLIK